MIASLLVVALEKKRRRRPLAEQQLLLGIAGRGALGVVFGGCSSGGGCHCRAFDSPSGGRRTAPLVAQVVAESGM